MSLYELERNGDVDELVRVLEGSDNERLAARAAELLGSFDERDGRQRAVDALVEGAGDDRDAVATAAIDALSALGPDAIEEAIVSLSGANVDAESPDEAKARVFARALSADRPELRMAAANALGRLEATDAVESLIDAFDDPDHRVRARAARACGRLADPRATTPLSDLLGDPNGTVRREAADALGAIASRQALQALLPLYQDDDERVRRIAVGAFGNFDNDRPVAYLVESLADDSLAVRRAAVFSLVELMANVPTEGSHEIRETVVERLSATDDRTVIRPLVEILEETTEPRQRRNTAWLLGRVTGEAERERVLDALVDVLSDDDEMVRQFAATSLAELGSGGGAATNDEEGSADGDGEATDARGSAVEERLLPIVRDEDAPVDVRGQAIFTLGKVGGEQSRQALDSLLEETERDELRERAFSAVSKLGGRT